MLTMVTIMIDDRGPKKAANRTGRPCLQHWVKEHVHHHRHRCLYGGG